MSDIIQLLPDSVANQIAAGEVIQRPASVVKELLENAVDAGSDMVQVIVKDAGKTLIRVIDNGCGMSDLDGRLCFEKHATSKIRSSADLFSIRTKGFRGEALASIAAIAQVELKSRLTDEELGTQIQIEGTEVKNQEPCSCSTGASFSVKNLFFNVPARRQFLKSDQVEFRHIVDEFERVAMSHPGIAFKLNHNDAEIFNLPATTPRKRIVGIFGPKYNQRLVPVEENTDIVSIEGFIGKPEFARKTRGEQFIFVNHRFIKNHYLNHAVVSAFDQLLPHGMFPMYVLFLDIDPKEIDVNIHPTKTEIKFRDERSVYAVVNAAIKQSLGKFNIAPTLDFEQETAIRIDPMVPGQMVKPPSIKVNTDYNPFESNSSEVPAGGVQVGATSSHGWESLYEIARTSIGGDNDPLIQQKPDGNEKITGEAPVFQIYSKYIVTTIKSGIVVVNQQLAHERILFERNLVNLENNKGPSQQLLFPQTLSMKPAEFSLLQSRLEEVQALGCDIEEFGPNTFKITGLPADSKIDDPEVLLQSLTDQIKFSQDSLNLKPREELALAMARAMGIKHGMRLSDQEMRGLLDELFACQVPEYCPAGKKTIAKFTQDDINEKFE
jgi:DNA mismatch repair protein MutL